ncbi:MAG TPA: SMP-30/gluconolactonase/LRE family protein [Micropepsaceae bacterium]|nr:SMP-30/gluconolactonase/LRE family protein [Micropepsaceae bacterium]
MRRHLGTVACWFIGSTLALGGIAVAQQGTGRAFPQPSPEKQVTVTAIPGVIAAGAQWKLVWQGPDNADGLVGTKDGGILFAQEQPSTVGRLDRNDKFSIFAADTHGTGALAIDYKGRVIGAERTCSDPGGHPDQCHEPAQLIVIEPGNKHETLASEYNGKTFWRMGEVVSDSKGGAYFYDDNGTYFVNAAGKVSLVAGKEVRTNGMVLSRDEKTLYVTNRKVLVAFDIKPDGTTANQHDFARLEGGGNGDGMTIDSEGRLYVSTGDPGIQVFSADGKYLGIIPLPRSASSVAFAGAGKRVLYAKGAGMKTPDGQEYRTAGDARNNAKAIYKIDMIAQGYMGRAK